jgi:hypothetical protein
LDEDQENVTRVAGLRIGQFGNEEGEELRLDVESKGQREEHEELSREMQCEK